MYGNGDEGDQSAGPAPRPGPGGGRGGRHDRGREAFMRAWREAGQHMNATPVLGPPLDADVLVRPADRRRAGRR